MRKWVAKLLFSAAALLDGPEEKSVPGTVDRAFAKVHQWRGSSSDPDWIPPDFPVPLDDANLVTSHGKLGAEKLHYPVLDIDYEARLVPSTTPGHYHLYLDKGIPWSAYRSVLEALGAADLIEPGYVNASIDRGFSAVRLPWVKKEKADASPDVQ